MRKRYTWHEEMLFDCINLNYMTKDSLRFEIDQLRKDKIIYATEAIAVNSAMLLAIIAGMLTPYGPFVVTGAVAIGIGYTLFVGYTNLKRFRRIQQLEKELKDA